MSASNLAPRLKLFLTLLTGIVIGFTLAQILNSSKCQINITPSTISAKEVNINYQNNIQRTNAIQLGSGSPVIDKTTESLPMKNGSENLLLNHTIADFLYRKVRVLCWVLTGPKNHEKKAIHVKRTWGSRCNKLLFMSSVNDTQLGAIGLPVGEGRGQLWHKTREAAKYIYENYYNDADWFLKADDDTYVILENLRSFLYTHSSEEPVYFGCKFKPHVKQGYMSGGAGYVLSREALRRFVVDAYPRHDICRQRMGGSEDKEMGLCLQNVGVAAGDSRDKLKRGRFFPSTPTGHIIPKDKNHWYWRYVFYATKDGLNCCSEYAISFHYIQPNYMYVLDYLIYSLKPFGILPVINELPAKENTAQLFRIWRQESSDNPLK